MPQCLSAKTHVACFRIHPDRGACLYHSTSPPHPPTHSIAQLMQAPPRPPPSLARLPSLPQIIEEEEEEEYEERQQTTSLPPPQQHNVAFPRPTSPSSHQRRQRPSFRFLPTLFQGVLKSRRQLRWQLRLEWALLRHEWPWIMGFAVVEYLHLAARNLVYYVQGQVYHYPHNHNKREHPPTNFPYPPIKDLGFMALDAGNLLPASLEWLMSFFMAALVALMLLLWLARLLLNVRFAGPKTALTGRDVPDRPLIVLPVPLVLIIKRMAMAGIVVIPLRCLTFLVTLLPPPARHCQSAWSPPTTMHQVFNPFISPRTGCGDAMFSGHTLHGTLITLMVFRYFSYHRVLPALASVNLALLALSLIIFRSHYTADVTAALYVTAGGWFLLPRESATLNGYGLYANVLVRPSSYLTTGTDRHVARDVLRDLEVGGALQGDEKEGGVEEECEREGLATWCWTCGQRRQRRGPKVRYLPPLPSTGPPLVGVEDRTASEWALERLPW